MAGNRELPVQVGDVIHVPEPDYRFGSGTLRLRITGIGEIYQETDGAWIRLRGVELRSNRRETGEREASVRFSVLAAAKRAAMGGKP